MGMVLGLKAFCDEVVFPHFHHLFILHQERFQDFTVFQECVIDFSDDVITHFSQLVVVGVAAEVITELLVGSPINWISTVQATSFVLLEKIFSRHVLSILCIVIGQTVFVTISNINHSADLSDLIVFIRLQLVLFGIN